MEVRRELDGSRFGILSVAELEGGSVIIFAVQRVFKATEAGGVWTGRVTSYARDWFLGCFSLNERNKVQDLS